jgi:hypothetical protein
MEAGWSMAVNDAINQSRDAILVVTDGVRHEVVARSIAAPGRFVLACDSSRVPDILALFRFHLVVLLGDVPLGARLLVREVLTQRRAENCTLIDDAAAGTMTHIAEKAA